MLGWYLSSGGRAVQLVTTLECNYFILEAIRPLFTDTLLIGLMQGDTPPARDWTTSNVVEAVFSGYLGVQPVSGWTPSLLVGQKWVIKALPVIWWHMGGLASCRITGYFVTDLAGQLRWAQLFEPPYNIMQSIGDVFQVVPEFSDYSQYP